MTKILSINFVHFLEKKYFLSLFPILYPQLLPVQFHGTFHPANLVNFLETCLKFSILVQIFYTCTKFSYFFRFQNEDSIEKVSMLA